MLDSQSFKNGIIYKGDAYEVLKQLDSNVIEVCVTSPPYNLNIDQDSSEPTSKTALAFSEKYKEWYDDRMDEYMYQGYQKAVMHELIRVCKSSIFYNHKIRYAWHSRNKHKTLCRTLDPYQWLQDFPIWCHIIWDRCGIGHPHNRYHIQSEMIYQIKKPKKWDNKYGLTNIWRIPPSKNNGHVCSFPDQLVYNCIDPTTTKGDTILDPFLGSGTVALVAMKKELKFVGIERDQRYFDLACQRVRQLEETGIQGSLF
tara:strand:+ start:355 stop:1122 length:768 start_codon:yes stop_codon:yes gene_type:complete